MERTRSSLISFYSSVVLFVSIMGKCSRKESSMNAFVEWWMFITTSVTVVTIWRVLYRLSNPHSCACGFKTVFIGRFKRHVLQGHKWVWLCYTILALEHAKPVIFLKGNRQTLTFPFHLPHHSHHRHILLYWQSRIAAVICRRNSF